MRAKILLNLTPTLLVALLATACGGEEEETTEVSPSRAASSEGCSVEDGVITCADGSEYDLRELAGTDGADGADGSKGADGSNGSNGSNGANGVDGVNGNDGNDGQDASSFDAASIPAGLTRLATVPLGAEVTGAYLAEDGSLFFNVQHPDDTNTTADADSKVFDRGTVGYLAGLDVNQLPMDLSSNLSSD